MISLRIGKFCRKLHVDYNSEDNKEVSYRCYINSVVELGISITQRPYLRNLFAEQGKQVCFNMFKI